MFVASDLHALARLPEEWEQWARVRGLPAYRGRQIFRWVHHCGVIDAAMMTDLPASLREVLRDEARLPFEVVRVHRAADATEKILIQTEAGGRSNDRPPLIETVLIPQLRDRDPDRDEDAADVLPGRVPGPQVTQCISSQVGCAMGCVFCASGLAGLKRSLTAAEIIGQVWLGRTHLQGAAPGDEANDGAPPSRLRNVVFMGMGEPLHNYDAVARALRLFTHPDGMALSSRRVTVSTSGLVPEIDRLGKDFGGKIQLAVSLHAVSDDQRSALMPINRRYPLKDLMAALRRYPLPKRRRITIEYTLLRGVNDSAHDASELVRLLRGVPVKVNVIPMNPVIESPLHAPDYAAVDRFRTALQHRGVTCLVRTQRGDDISAACGQLALRAQDGSRAPVKIRRSLT